MDNNGGSKEAIDSQRKPLKRRSHRRKVTHDRVINMAEARREVAHALHLHRSSSSSSPPSSSSSSSSSPSTLVCNSSRFYCYTVMNTLPAPEPVWSTTSPSVLAGPPQLSAEPQAARGFGWTAFLKDMDSNAKGVASGKCQNVSRVGEGPLMVESSDLSLSSCADEWLIFPSAEDQDET